MGGHIFVSYAREDLAYVTRLLTFLARAGIQVWMDEDIPTGERWAQLLMQKIETCESLLIVMSPPAAASEWVAREVRYAQELNKPVLPLLLEGSVIFSLGRLQYENVTDRGMPSPAFVQRLRGIAPTRTVTRHVVGAVPDVADCYQDREVAERLDQTLALSTTAILTENRARILSGLGGVGKTQLAASVARQMRDSGGLELLLWLPATNVDAIMTGYARAGWELTGTDPSDPPAAAAALMAWLATTTSPWLIVLDDLTDPRDLDGWWPPQSSTGRVVVTTRRRDAALATHGALVDVGWFTVEEAMAYLSEKFSHQPERLAGAEELARDLGYLPLALAQATAYIIDRDITCADYRVRFADRHRTLADLTPDSLPDDYTIPVAVTLSLSVEVADNLAPRGLARALMAGLALLDPNAIPAGVVTTGAMLDYLSRHRDSRTAAGPVDREQARDAVTCLARLNLIDGIQESAGRRLRVHALTQRARRDAMNRSDLLEVGRVVADALDEIWPERRDALTAQTLRSNARALLDHADEALWLPQPHPVLYKIGDSLGDHGNASQAVHYFAGLTARMTNLYGAQALAVMEARHCHLMWTGKNGDHNGAREGLAALITDLRGVVESTHPLAIEVHADHAFFQGECGDYTAAIAESKSLMDQVRSSVDPDVKMMLALAGNVAFFLGKQGEYAHAARAYRALLPDMAGFYGADHLDTLKARSNAAGWTGRAGDETTALAEYREMLPDFERALGATHIQTVRIRYHIVRLSWDADPDRAETEFRQTIATISEMLGGAHPHTIDARYELAKLLVGSGRVTAAIVELRAALADAETVLGPIHPIVDKIRAMIGELTNL